MNPVLYKLQEKTKLILKREKGTIIKPFEGRITVALVYPNLYKIGMSNLGFQKIYSLLNKEEHVVCERVFLPEKEDIDLLKKNRLPLFSLESGTPVEQFDIAAFSITFELDYLNILHILDLAHIPFKTKDRQFNYPVIAAGGICPTFNPEPIADFIDIIVIGEGEAVLPEFIAAYSDSLNRKEHRKNFFDRIAKIRGIYIPSAYRIEYKKNGIVKKILPDTGYPSVIAKAFPDILDDSPTASNIITPDTIFSDMYLIEVERGCPMGCNFCAGGHIYRPQRAYSLECIIDQIKSGMKLTDKIGLVGMALCNYTRLNELCAYCEDSGANVSISSLRMDMASDNLLRLLAASGHKTITFAPETGSERLRKLINKNISNDQIMEAIKKALMHNILNIKLYFLIGLPGEDDNDIEAIIYMAHEIKNIMLQIAKKKHRIGRIILSITPFIPKPFTPFQLSVMEDTGSLKQKIKRIRSALKNVSNIKIIYDSAKWPHIQGVLSMGSRRIGELLLKTYDLNGDWHAAFKELNIDYGFYIYRNKEKDEILPWSHIDVLPFTKSRNLY